MMLRTGRVDEEAGETSGRPDDHFDRGATSTVVSSPLGVLGWARWSWRQLTSMRTALLLLLLLALAAVPGSLFPQRSSDPNGVIQYFKSNPSGAKTIDALQLFNVYTSVWFSAIYLVLFISLIGCVIPRTRHHWIALRQSPPRTPRNMARLPVYERRIFTLAENAVEPITAIRAAEGVFRAQRYRTRLYENDNPVDEVNTAAVSAERGYLRETVPFLPQDANLTSLGVIKVPDGLAEQVGMIGFFYPTKAASTNGTFASIYPDLQNPVLTLNVYTGDLGLSTGNPKSVYALDTSMMTQIAGRGTANSAIEIRPGESAQLPDGLGSVEFLDTKRFASFDISHDPTKGFMLFFAITVIAGLGAAFFVPRRRIWVRASKNPQCLTVEYGGLSRGDDPALEAAIGSFTIQHENSLHQQSRSLQKKGTAAS